MNNQSINQSDFSQNVEGFEDIKQCWTNILYTIPGEFPLLPEFGCDLWQYIDKPNSDSFGKLRNVIIAALEKYEPRAKVTKVTRTVENERIFINLMGIHIETGGEIIAQITPLEIDENMETKRTIYIGAVNNQNPTEYEIQEMAARFDDKVDQSFIYNIDFRRPCFAFPSAWGDITSVIDHNGFEIISGFAKSSIDLTINATEVNYNMFTMIYPTTQSRFTIIFKF